MLKASELDTNKIINEAKKSELGILLVEKDTEEPNFLDVLLSSAGMKMAMMNGKGDTISCHILPIMHKHKTKIKQIENIRNVARKILFNKWTVAIYNKHHTKDISAYEEFRRYCDKINYHEADYLLVCKEDKDNDRNPDIKLN